MRNLSELIALALEEKKGNKEFLLSFDGSWTAEIGNYCLSVRLGEVSGEIGVSDYDTPEEAVSALIDAIQVVNDQV